MDIITSTDRRGEHWRSKVEKGAAPTPWKHTAFWAAQRDKINNEFMLRAAAGRIVCPRLPWNLPEAGTVGNTSRALWMHLMVAHSDGLIKLEHAAESRKGFMGIVGFLVPQERRTQFDAGLFPTLAGFGDSEFPFQRKTLAKIWHYAGLVESQLNGSVSVRYDAGVRARMKASARRIEDRRRGKPSRPRVDVKEVRARLVRAEALLKRALAEMEAAQALLSVSCI